MPTVKRVLCLFLLATAGLWSQGPFELARPALHVQGMEDGLPSGTIYGFAQDTKGRLWAGTVDGPATYTGHGWVPVRLPKESPSQWVRNILASADGSLWFATQDGGVWRLQDGAWTHYSGDRDLPSNHAYCVSETRDAQGRLLRWVGTADQGLACFDGTRWRAWRPRDGFPGGTVWRIREIQRPDGQRQMWAATEKGLCVLEGDRWRLLGPQDGFPAGDTNDILDVTEADGSRSVWVSIWDKGLARWDRRGWTHFPSGGAFPGRFPTSSLSLSRDAAGQPILWVGTLNQGLWWYHQGRWQGLGQGQGFLTVGILGLLPLPEGKPTLLIGTRGGGVASLDLGGWRTLDQTLGLPSLEVTCFSELSSPSGERSFWVGTTAGLAAFQPGRAPVRVDTKGFPSDYFIALLATEDALWAGTLNGLLRKDARGWHRVDGEGALPQGMIICLLETRSRQGVRTLWVGTPRGLARYQEGRWSLLTRQHGLPVDFVSSLCAVPGPDGEPTLWAGTRGGGVARLQGGVWTTFGANAGLSNGTVYALHPTVGPDGRRWLWAGTLGGGLAWLDLQNPQRWEGFSRESLPGLRSDYVQRIEEDRQGRLYLSTSAGVVRVRLDLSGSKPRPTAVETFTLGDGLPSQNGNLGASFLDAQGRIWVGTSQGATVLDPALETFSPPPPLPVLEQVTVGDRARELTQGLQLDFRDRNLRFEFSLPVFHRKEDIRYQTQLVGLEGAARPWQQEAWREFATLPAGSYTLRLWGRAYDGRVAGPVEFSFWVAPPPWRHPLAYLAYGLTAVGAVLGLLWMRTRVLRERTEALTMAVKERTRIIEQQSLDLAASNQELQGRNQELSLALAEVKTLRGLIPICAYCKKIRDDQGSWDQMEHYISHHSDAQFSHGICPDCKGRFFDEPSDSGSPS